MAITTSTTRSIIIDEARSLFQAHGIVVHREFATGTDHYRWHCTRCDSHQIFNISEVIDAAGERAIVAQMMVCPTCRQRAYDAEQQQFLARRAIRDNLYASQMSPASVDRDPGIRLSTCNCGRRGTPHEGNCTYCLYRREAARATEMARGAPTPSPPVEKKKPPAKNWQKDRFRAIAEEWDK